MNSSFAYPNSNYLKARRIALSSLMLGLLLGLLPVHGLAQGMIGELPTLREVKLPSGDYTLPKPMRVRNERGQVVLLSGITGDTLNIELPGAAGAEIGIDINSENLQILVEYPERFAVIQTAYNNGDFAVPATELKALCSPLFHFLRIPQGKTNIHPLMLMYYRSLCLVGDVADAVRATALTPINSDALDPAFRESAELLLARCISEDQIQAAEQIISILNSQLPEDVFAQIALRTADQLRTKNQISVMERIYGTLTRASSPEIRQQANLWAVYSYAVSGNVLAARSLLDTLPELKQNDEHFNIYCLSRGRLAMAESNYNESLRFLTRAMVLTSIEDSYKPELYYLVVKTYTDSGEINPAIMLTRELLSFYPENPWTQAVAKDYPEIYNATSPSDNEADAEPVPTS